MAEGVHHQRSEGDDYSHLAVTPSSVQIGSLP